MGLEGQYKPRPQAGQYKPHLFRRHKLSQATIIRLPPTNATRTQNMPILEQGMEPESGQLGLWSNQMGLLHAIQVRGELLMGTSHLGRRASGFTATGRQRTGPLQMGGGHR